MFTVRASDGDHMTNKREVAIVIVGLGASFAFGRYSVRAAPAITVQSTAVAQVKEDKKTHIIRKEVTARSQTGEVVKTVTTETTIQAQKDTATKNTAKVVEKPIARKSYNISGLVGVDASQAVPIYGIAVSREFIGPITGGVFGLTSGVVGISIGINF